MELSSAVRSLAALAQASRLRVFRLLVRQGPEGLAAGEIAEALSIPAPTLSFHLSQLASAGLVASRREGRRIIYGIDVAGTSGLLLFLAEDCCAGSPELCGTPGGRAAEREVGGDR